MKYFNRHYRWDVEDSYEIGGFVVQYELDTFAINVEHEDTIEVFLQPLNNSDDTFQNCWIQDECVDEHSIIGFGFAVCDSISSYLVINSERVKIGHEGRYSNSTFKEHILPSSLQEFLKKHTSILCQGYKDLLVKELGQNSYF